MNTRQLENGSRKSTDVLLANRAAGDPFGQRNALRWHRFLSDSSLQTQQIKQSPEL
jgi:hypothetical protein